MSALPTYTYQKRKGNIGEALVQYLLSHFCLVHKIDGSNDIGNDFICELVKQDYPTNLLFYVQVKFTKNPPRVAKTTMEYWKNSPIPVYLFWIKGTPPSSFNSFPDYSLLEKYYKRMTPVLHNPNKHRKEKFKIFSEKKFKYDLIIDYQRSQYIKGFVPIVEPKDFLSLDEKSILGFPKYQILLKKVVPEYREEILKRSWIQPMVIATLISRDNFIKENINLAVSLLDLAEMLLGFSNEDNKQAYQDMLKKQRNNLLNKQRDLG